MASLKEITQQIADTVGKPYDNATKKRIQSLLIMGRGKYVKQQIAKYGVDGRYAGQTNVAMEKVKIGETCGNESGCYILRSVNKIPRPIMYRSSEPFINVSSDNGQIIAIKTTRTNQKHVKFTRYIHSIPTYDYRNGYLYVYNNTLYKHMLIDFIPQDIKYSDYDANCESGDCYQEDYEFMLDDDLIVALKIDIYKELGLNINEDDDIPVAKDPPQLKK